jgi:UDP-N-acetylmuramate--alanine ligase
MVDTMKHVHLIGICGSGLSAIALVLLERGYHVSGSDRQVSPMFPNLQAAGAQIFIGHSSDNIVGADVVVRSSAIPDCNVEVKAALAVGIPVLKRSNFLPILMTNKQCVAIAGTHGKTTTTAMVAWILTALKIDPSYIIGGVSINLGRNAHAGKGKYFVIEADEYDQMFLGLKPNIAVITNIEHDHPDYYPTPLDFYRAFQNFAKHLESGGILVVCGDDHDALRLASEVRKEGHPTYTYGLGDEVHNYEARQLELNRQGSFSFDVTGPGLKKYTSVHLQVPGTHNVLNALAALAVVDLLGIPLKLAAEALSEFRGVGRRFELKGEVEGITIIDDYAHHPTEIIKTLNAASLRYPGRPIWAVWQPHTYSRTRTLLNDFAHAFDRADHIVVLDIYAARESTPINGFSSQNLVEAFQQNYPSKVDYTPGLSEAHHLLQNRLSPGDVVLILSAGDADQLSEKLVKTLSQGFTKCQKESKETL